MKKILSILFVAVLALGMASCKSNEEKAVDEFVTLCDKIVDAADAADAAEIIKLSGDMIKLGQKYEKMEKDGDLKLSDEQQKRIQDAAMKAQRAMTNMDVDFDF